MVLALIFMFTVTAGAEEITEGEQTEPVVVDSGECGAEGGNVLWTLYSNGVLEITGTGAMDDFGSGHRAPWFEYRIGTNPSVVITSIVINSGVTRIGNWAFDQLNLQNATIPGTVETIGNHAFSFCGELTSLTLPVGVIELEEYAFDNCKSLAYVSLPDGLEIIGGNAFSTTDLTGIIIPSTVKEIGSFAFYNTELASLNIPASVTTIGEAAFMHNEALTYVEIPATVTNIGTRLFEYCTNLVSVKLPDNMEEIPERMFWYCYDLTDITIPDSVIKIGDTAFWYATSLSEINIPSKVKEIGQSAFGNTALKTISLPASLETIDRLAFNIDTLSSIDVDSASPNFKSVDGVLYSKDMTELVCYPAAKEDETYTIPNGVTSIRDFYTTDKLTSLTIPRTVTKMQDCDFISHTLTDIYFKGTSEEFYQIIGLGSVIQRKNLHFHESHTMSEWTIDSAASCQNEGEKSRYCTDDCGYSETEVIPVAEHTMGAWYTAVNPACAEDGLQIRECTYNCGTSEEKVIPATGHKDSDPYNGYCDTCDEETDAMKNCSCNCHKDGIMGIIWKIISFFYKIFKTNPQCTCGASHY